MCTLRILMHFFLHYFFLSLSINAYTCYVHTQVFTLWTECSWPPQFCHVDTLTPKAVVSGGGAFGRRLYPECGALRSGICALVRDPREPACPFQHWVYGDSHQARCYLHGGLPSLRNDEKYISVVYTALSLWYFITADKLTKTVSIVPFIGRRIWVRNKHINYLPIILQKSPEIYPLVCTYWLHHGWSDKCPFFGPQLHLCVLKSVLHLGTIVIF